LIEIIMFDTSKQEQPIVSNGDFGITISRNSEDSATVSSILGEGNPASMVVTAAFGIHSIIKDICNGDPIKEGMLVRLFEKAFKDFEKIYEHDS